MATPRKGLQLDHRKHTLTSPVSDNRWAAIWKHVPYKQLAQLKSGDDTRLRKSILECCSWYITQQKRNEESAKSAKVKLQGTEKHPTPPEQLIKKLRETADIWKKGVRGFHDDLLGSLDLRNIVDALDNLDSMAMDLEKRFVRLREKEPHSIEPTSWDQFVHMVAECFRQKGLNPGAGGGVYNETQSFSWFQKFMIALNDGVLGKDGRKASSDKAFAASIAKALHSYGNTGNAG